MLGIFGQHRILYQRMKKYLIFEILKNTLFFEKTKFCKYSILNIINTFFRESNKFGIRKQKKKNFQKASVIFKLFHIFITNWTKI